MSANFWDFVGGASDYLLKQRVDTQQQAAAQKRELEKAKAKNEAPSDQGKENKDGAQGPGQPETGAAAASK